jgi:hypothetical protein
MTYSPMLLIHISAGIVGVFSGYMAFFVRKGGVLHVRAGNVFVGSMLIMSASGGVVSFTRAQHLNVVMALFTAYLVATGWLTLRRKANETGAAEYALLLFALATAIGAMMVAGKTSNHMIFPAILLFVCAAGDVRMLMRGGLAGGRRLVRHIWRMGFGLFIAAASFFLGTPSDPVTRRVGLRGRLFPPALRETHLNALPVILIVVLIVYWVVRVKFKKRSVAV